MEAFRQPGKGRPEFPPVDRPDKSFPRGFQFQQMTPLIFWVLDIQKPARASLRAVVGMPPPPFGRFSRTWYAAVSDGMCYQYGASRVSWHDAANDAIVLLSRIGIIYPGDEVIPLPGSNGPIDKLRHAGTLLRMVKS